MWSGKGEANFCPELIDFTSSPTTVFIRHNIQEINQTNPETGVEQTVYQWDEVQMSKAEYIQTLHERQEQTDEALQELILMTFGGEE